MRLSLLVLLLPGFAFAEAGVATNCESLTHVDVPGLEVGQARRIRPAPDYVVMERPGAAPDVTVSVPFCRIAGKIDGSIGFELWLPDDWNGRFFSAGVGGYAGHVGVYGMAPALERGYAASSTDTGHQGDGATFMHDEQALENYAYRGVHRTADISKRLIGIYYGRPQKFSYFSGCSGGGYAGLANAQRYPDDYNGIISGAPGTLVTHHAARAMWTAALNREGRPGRIPSSKDQLIPDAVMKACDAGDGVRDGLVGNPQACDFDLAALECTAGEDSTDCLTPAQLETARQLYGPMLDAGGSLVYPATAPGTPLPADALTKRGEFYAVFWQNAVFDPDWDPTHFNVDDLAIADAKLRRYLDASDPDLSAFRKRGGKLLLYHGWYDAGVSPLNTIDYYENLDRADGDIDVHDYARLFLAPGMAHCAGGIGPDRFDMLTALENWVERGEAPDRIIAAQYENGRLVRTRPLCPYERVAMYDGSGRSNEADNFDCVIPGP